MKYIHVVSIHSHTLRQNWSKKKKHFFSLQVSFFLSFFSLDTSFLAVYTRTPAYLGPAYDVFAKTKNLGGADLGGGPPFSLSISGTQSALGRHHAHTHILPSKHTIKITELSDFIKGGRKKAACKQFIEKKFFWTSVKITASKYSRTHITEKKKFNERIKKGGNWWIIQKEARDCRQVMSAVIVNFFHFKFTHWTCQNDIKSAIVKRQSRFAPSGHIWGIPLL